MALKQKNALITGACGGLGRAIAEEFLMEGANVVVCDIRKDLVDDFKEKVSAGYPECTLAVECDITKDDSIDEMFEQAEKMFGHLDIVVNCAGMMDKFDPVGDLERSMWDKLMALNLTAPAMVTKRAITSMTKTETKGSIINIASIAGIVGFTAGVAYTVSKHGLIGLTKNTAAFYGPKSIRCNAILPGGMATNIFENFGKNFGQNLNMEAYTMMRKSYPEELSPMVEIEKVAKMAVHLSSDAGSILNGACIVADGGTSVH